jgi:pilus assembly protein CpaB
MILLSLIAGIAATVMAARWLSQQGTVVSNKVVVAASDLGIGQALTTAQLKLVEWPIGSTPSGAFRNIEDVTGRVARIDFLRDEVILEPKLAAKGTKGGLSAVIGEGKRAITVRVNDVVGVAGFALPGNYVDVIVNTMSDKTSTDKTTQKDPLSVSKIVLEKILVLAVAQEAGRDDSKPKVVNAVTLEVTPEDAERIDLARSVGSLSLVLRNQIESAVTKTSGATKDSLLGRPQPIIERPVSVTPVIKVVKAVVKPVPVEPAVVVPKASVPVAKTCIDSFVGTSRVAECF